jgi:tetratricopeptide (TPR) repeat protein
MNIYIRKILQVSITAASILALGCGGTTGSSKTVKKPTIDASGQVVVSQQAKEEFNKSASEFKEALKTGLNSSNCDQMASHFDKLARKHGIPDAAFNVGVVYDKCGKNKKARSTFEDVLKNYKEHIPTQQRALTYLAYLDIKDGNISDAESKLKQAVGLGRNTLEAVPAYTMAATILRKKAMNGDKASWGKCQKALRTALAIDAKYMPALYQLSRLYYSIAVTLNKKSYLTLASLVVDQAKKTDPEFAPVYLVLGQILLQKNELVEALKAFEKAFKIDPRFYEAYMSFAAINLNFRGYEEAKMAFQKAVELRPDNYDAHMGLGVAARGLGDYAMAKSEYKKASEIDKARTDYIFNLGVLEMDYEDKGSTTAEMVAAYDKAAAIFEKFIKHATPEHKIDPDGKRGPQLSWVAKAKARIKTAHDAKKQILEAEKQMAELQKLAEEQKKREIEQAKLAKQAEELAKKEAEGAKAAAADIDEAQIEKELAAEEAAKEKDAEKAKEEQKSKEKAAEEAEKVNEDAPKADDVKL